VVFAVLLLVFAGFAAIAVRARRWWLQVPAACVAFVPAMVFGVVAVNKYYDYYGHWGDVVDDLDDSAPARTVPMAELGTPQRFGEFLSGAVQRREAMRSGFLFQIMLPGAESGIHRAGLVFLPPQYFEDRFQGLRFPVLELLHGGPGTPADYVRVMRVVPTYLELLSRGAVRPLVFVMPDSNGGRDVALQCLDTVRGPKDETYLVKDVATALIPRLRVQPPGPGWGVGGYSEGGYCAANLALRNPLRYALAGTLSGYYEPLPKSKLPRRVDPFNGNLRLRHANTPSMVVRTLPKGVRPPRFFVMAGTGSVRDRVAGQTFSALVRRVQPDVTYVTVRGGRHDFQSWRSVMPKFLEWASARLPAPG
jgi:enterochelin esterase-like enzyme